MGIIDIVLFRTLGDVLMGTVVAHAIKEKYPDSHIRFYTEQGYVPLLQDNPEINEVIAATTYMEVYDKQFKATIKPEHICKLGMANHYDTCWHHNEETANQHMIDFYVSRSGLDLKVTDYNVRFTNTDAQLSRFRSLNLPTKYIVMHTTSLLETKNWPLQYFNHLAQLLTKQYNIPIVQVGGQYEPPITGVISLLGKTDIGVTNLVIKNATFYVGVDSGSSYLAGAAKIPTFMIMGSSMGKPQLDQQLGPLVGPVGNNIHYIEAIRPFNPHCQPIPCINHCALQKPCINTIMPDVVFNTIIKEIH